jgi:hypothetical protein
VAQASIAERTDGSLRREQQAAAQWVRRSGVRSVALVDIGELGFRADVAILDLAGLTDRAIARAPGGHLDKRFDLGYVFAEQRPDLLLVRVCRAPGRDGAGHLAAAPADACSPIERRLLADPRLQRDYAPLFVLLPRAARSSFYGRMLWLRRGFALPEGALPPSDTVVIAESL